MHFQKQISVLLLSLGKKKKTFTSQSILFVCIEEIVFAYVCAN